MKRLSPKYKVYFALYYSFIDKIFPIKIANWLLHQKSQTHLYIAF